MENGKEEPSKDNPTNVVKIEADEREIKNAVLNFDWENGGQDNDRKRGGILDSIDEVFYLLGVIVTTQAL